MGTAASHLPRPGLRFSIMADLHGGGEVSRLSGPRSEWIVSTSLQ
jgi:hypothetical protein